MRSSSLAVLLGCAIALALPSAASAQDYSPFQVQTPYDALPIDGTTTPVTALALQSGTTTYTGYAVIRLPFTFFFYGQPFDQVNMSTEGYITFGSNPTGQGNATVTANQTIPTPTVPNTAPPTGLVAAWWDDNTCPAGTMKTQTYGDPGQRWFVMEWNGCTRSTSSTLQMQIRLQENSPIIQVYYGDRPAGSTAHSATVGIENPATYDDSGTMVTTGGTRGQYGLLDDATPPQPICTASCDRADWPVHTMIQYGRSTLPDLQAGKLQYTRLHKDASSIDVTIENIVVNGGLDAAVGVTWDIYLSEDQSLDRHDRLLCRQDQPVDVPGSSGSSIGSTRTDTDCTFQLQPGKYWFCVAVDPGDTILEANELNNSYCSDFFVFGSDLVGDISIRSRGEAGSRTPVHVEVANSGTDPTGRFEYAIYWKDCDGAWPARRAYTGTLALGGGGRYEADLELYLDPTIEARTVCAELVIDQAGAVLELNDNNNVASTCVGPGEVVCMEFLRADLEARQIRVDMPDGCYFGGPVGLEIEFCNNGETSARGFGAAFYIDDNTKISILDTMVLDIPRSCLAIDPSTGQYYDDESVCVDIGGGQPSCIGGICHPPCIGNGDCGNFGLECVDDPLLEVDGIRHNSCQLFVPSGECRWARGTTNLPTLDIGAADPQNPEGIPFGDGSYVIGAIADHTTAIAERKEDDNLVYVERPFTCRIRRPDFEAVELRSLSPVAAGELFPVFRRVKNNGPLPGTFSYRYVLSSNDVPSNNDIPVEILRIEDGQVVGWSSIAADAIGVSEILDAHDVIRIPAGVAPRDDYRLGIVIDPEATVPELSEQNNAAIWCDPQPEGGRCVPHPIQVLDSSLRIVTQSVRNVTVGQSYNVRLLAKGGAGAHEWSISSGELPPGLSLDGRSGLIHGTALEQGDYLFQVTVTSGIRSDAKAFAIRALPARSPLTITTSRLPTAYRNVEYAAELGASGGEPPYAWSCSGLPDWAEFEAGTITGKPEVAAPAVPVTCIVKDANWLTLTAVYALQVQIASDLRITSTSIEAFDLGEARTAKIDAIGGSGNYAWGFDDSTIPAGLRGGQDGNRGAIEGTPLVCGSFLVAVTVTDTGTGATDSAMLPLEVICDIPWLATRTVPEAVRGEDYPKTQLAAEGAVKFAVVIGALPRGLALSESGILSGKVASDADTGDYNVAIELSDRAGGTGLGALTIVVPIAARDLSRVEKVDKGCSTSGEGSASGLLPFAALLSLLGLRRAPFRRAAGLLLLLAAVALPSAAPAQASTQYYGSFSRSIVYQRLTDGTPAPGFSGKNINNDSSDAISLPFTFSFFGKPYNKIFVSSNGLLLFSGPSYWYYNAVIPNADEPNNFIAPWFDELEINQPEDIRTKVRGTAPDREFVVEWLVRNPAADNQPGGEMQVSLFEDGTIAMRWGDPGANIESTGASVGIEDADATAASIEYLTCSPSCTRADWLTHLQNKEVIFSTAANLVIVGTSTTPKASAGLSHEYRVKAQNLGRKAARAAIALFVSEDQEISRDDHYLGKTPDLDFAAGQLREENITLAPPSTLAPGPYYVLARVDPDDIAPEFNETDNDGGAYRFVIRDPMPDLAVNGIGAPPSGTPGSPIVVGLELANLGNLDVADVPYRIVLSLNEVISASDPVIYEGTLDIDWMAFAELSVLVEVPVGTPADIYYLGALIDPENAISELDELNNTRASAGEFVVTANGLLALTRLPAELQVGAPYCVPLAAEGGDGVYTWSLAEGTLPPGLDLEPSGEAEPNGTRLCGVPTTVGIYEFVLEVASSAMTQRTEQSLRIVAVPAELGVATRVLASADFNVPYEAGLTANGGLAPYRWRILSGDLPAGLTLAEDGLIFGRPLVDGVFPFDVEVVDANAGKASESIHLIVASPGRITCSTRALGPVEVGSAIDDQLRAGGGARPYKWTSLRTIRIGDSGGDPQGDDEAPPPGIELRESGEVAGLPGHAGRYLWTVEVADEAKNADSCTILVEILPGQGLTVTTLAIPPVLVGEEYSAQLRATGGIGDYRWALVDQGGLPNGLGLGKNGVISGKLVEADLRDEESRTWSFLVEVRDQQNNQGAGALSVTLTKRQEGSYQHRTKTTEGCSSGAGGFSLVALGLVTLGLRRRR